jgi:hypothetical protein
MTTTIHTISTLAKQVYKVSKARVWQWYKEERLQGFEIGADGRPYWKESPPRPEARGRGKKKKQF